MASVRTWGLLIIYDLTLWVVFWTWLVLSKFSSSGGLGGLWVLGGLRWICLYSLTLLHTDGKPQPALWRWVTVLCLLPPVFESGRKCVISGSTSDPHGPIPEPSIALLSLFSSSVACLAWEAVFPEGETRKESKSRVMLMRVVKYCRPDAFHLTAAFSFLIFGVISDTFIPYCQGKVIDMLRDQHQHHDSFSYAIGGLALVSLGSSLFSGLRGGMFMVSLCRLNLRMKHILFHNLLLQDIPFFEENKPGGLSSRLASDVDKMGRSVALNANVLVRSMVKTGLMLVLMLGLSWELTLLTCVEMPLLALLQNTYNTYGQDLKSQIQDCQAQTKELASQAIRAVRTVRSFRAEEKELQRYIKALDQIFMVQKRKGIFSAVHLLARRLVTLGIKVAMLWQGRRLMSSGQLSIGSLITFVLYQKPMATNMKEILFGFGDMVNTLGVTAKVLQFLDRKPKQKEAGELAPAKLEGRLDFHNVTLFYPSRPDKPVLKSVTLELRPGKMTALVGPSGGGKTSCVSLLERFYEPQEGQVLLDGQPLHCYQHQYLHRKMTLVSQDPVLFSGSVRHNIEYGLHGCTPEKVIEAAKKANAHDFICDLKNGYDTDVGECGGKLSSGQKQCIAIARALVRDPQVLILDEATSNLDVNMQHAIQRVLVGSQGQTVLVVAHRLQTVEKADHIIFVEDGHVAEQGTHQQLMDKKGRYHRLKEELFT
ncbi:antigen peptide transporter 2 isoform X1 [Osmerus mordax]|uniref:antigen peptide transporter 2 isoform X1 n=1 Tax=Osmerus mordax TaxID=8014 RepID=UPI00350EC122